MDRDLNRSVRILEDAIAGHGKSLLRTPGTTPKRSKMSSKLDINSPLYDLSMSLNTDEPQRLPDNKLGSTTMDDSLRSVLQDRTVMGSIISTNKPWENAAYTLYMEFLETTQSRTNIGEIFETVRDLATCCTDTLNVIRGMKTLKTLKNEEKWLENERNTWRLLYCLYQNRLNPSDKNDEMMPYLGVSEKLCIENLYKRDSLIRETQLVIDWLECNASDNECDLPKMEYFTDKTCGWENTLHQLRSSTTIVYKSSRKIVSSIDPDVVFREKLALHDLDAEDDDRLCKRVFYEIRCGRLADAQKLCMHCGHAWRASLLEGWRLYHNPNSKPNTDEVEMETDTHNLTVENIIDKTLDRIERQNLGISKKKSQAIEGNVNRDLWKQIALRYCDQDDVNIYQRASVAAFCGHLKALLQVSLSWEDQLWSYMRTMVDIRVESEIRDYIPKEYKPLPTEYWESRISMDDIFDKIAASTDKQITDEANSRDHLIQKYIILDQIPKLMATMEDWISLGNCNTQFLRFLAHLVLFFRQIGVGQQDEIGNKVLESYVEALMKLHETQLVAYYVATLGKQKQVQLYASYLENITEKSERELCLNYAEDVGLDVKSVTKQVVENIRNRSTDIGMFTKLQRTTTDYDSEKISALDWVLFNESQRVEAIHQCNALICYFLTIGKIEAAKSAFLKIPPNSIDLILSRIEEGAPKSIQDIIREHLSYKTYLDAQDAFNDWFKYFHHSRPVPPAPLSESASFTEKVAHEHRVSQHRAETERWKLSVLHLAKTAKTMLYNIILFPDGGWLTGLEHSEHLRHTCIPETFNLLHKILSESGDHTECIQLADILASEKYCLYKVYNKEQLEDILKNFFESSINLLDQNRDMWGNKI